MQTAAPGAPVQMELLVLTEPVVSPMVMVEQEAAAPVVRLAEAVPAVPYTFKLLL